MPTAVVDPPLAASAQQIRHQLDRLLHNEALRTSRRSVAFLRYIVEQTLEGNAEELKERTIGVHVFGRPLTYDTANDHVVRTAASELRRRLALYYSAEAHHDELRIALIPGSYVPQFSPALPQPDEITPVEPLADTPIAPASEPSPAAEPQPIRSPLRFLPIAALVIAVAALALWLSRPTPTPREQFWAPLLHTEGPILVALGDVPGGPPVADKSGNQGLPPSPSPSIASTPTVPFADAVAMARIAEVFSHFNKQVIVRQEDASSFADLREHPTVLIGSFNNTWSLRLTRNLRFSLALDQARNIVYIRDRDHPESRAWSWSTLPHPEDAHPIASAPLHDYALISRILDSETGHEVVVLGGLYTYGTQAAGEFVVSPQLLSLARDIPLSQGKHTLQIVLETQVTQSTPGPPRVVAFYAD